MSNNEERETVVPISTQELFYYDEDSKTHKPLVSDGVMPVRIVEEGELNSLDIQSSEGEELTNRETRMYIPKQELFYYDSDKKVYKPLINNGVIPVHIVGGNMVTYEQFNTYINETSIILSELRREIELLSGFIFKDDFNRENISTLGSDWEVYSGTWSILNNEAKPTTSGATNVAVVDVETQGNISVKSVVYPVVSEGIIFKALNKDNHFIVQFEGNKVILSIRVNGTKTQLQSVDYVYEENRPYNFRVELRNTEIKVFIDNQLVITQTDSRLAEVRNKYGLTSYTYSGAENGRFDNFEIRKLSD